MSERGVYAVDRGIWDHPDFANEPFTEREAWQWLIGSCVWEPKRVRIGHAVVDLERGQCAFSLRFMAKRWQWSEPRVRRFLNRSKTDARAIVDSTQGTTRITVCNYDKYQFGRRAGDSADDAQPDAAPTQHRRKEEELKELKKEEKKDSQSVGSATRPQTVLKFEEFWKVFPRRLGSNPKGQAEEIFIAAVKRGANPDEIIAGAARFAAQESENVGTKFIPQAVKWVRNRGWIDGTTDPPPGSGLSDEDKRQMFEKLRGPNGQSERKRTDVRSAGVGAREVEGARREEPTSDANNQTRHTGMAGLGTVFREPLGFRAGSDEAGSDGSEPRIYCAGPITRDV